MYTQGNESGLEHSLSFTSADAKPDIFEQEQYKNICWADMGAATDNSRIIRTLRMPSRSVMAPKDREVQAARENEAWPKEGISDNEDNQISKEKTTGEEGEEEEGGSVDELHQEERKTDEQIDFKEKIQAKIFQGKENKGKRMPKLMEAYNKRGGSAAYRLM